MFFLPKLSLYIHIPWCKKKCPYCDFNSIVSKKYISENYYIKQLIQDFKNDVKFIKNRTITTIFIGGGTPNLFSSKSIKYLIDNIKTEINIDQNAEITMEMNPEFMTYEKILQYQKIGINRISCGIQSFNHESLKILQRNHSIKKTNNLLNKINQKNNNINLDLMYGLPQQTLKNCLYDLKKAILIQPKHISWYQLSIEKNTPFYSQKLNIPNHETIWKMYQKGNYLLKKAKYIRYEISAYSKLNYQCLHNLNYWKFGDYIGIGCGAHGKITQKNGNIIRLIKNKNIHNYLYEKKYINKIYNVLDKNKPFEYFMNVCRLFKPIKRKNFYLYTGLKENDIKKNIQQCIKKKYIIQTNKYWHVLPHGKNFLNNLLKIFL